MADVPVPKSYNQNLADLLDAFFSRTGLNSAKVGAPLLSLLEAIAQSDTRTAQDIFNLLDSSSIDRATGDALDKLAADEGSFRRGAVKASGFINIIDSGFTKVSSTIYVGAAAPSSGSTTVKIADGSNFPSAGQIYVGRGTLSYEGPVSYTSIAYVAPYWEITLSSGLSRSHSYGESVILAQGGNRTIAAGSTVQTPQGNVTKAVKFTTLYNAEILDGETLLENVEVISVLPGSTSNIPAGAITEFNPKPFVSATATNPLPFTNARDTETDTELRERIKVLKQTRNKGTVLSLINGVIGASSKEDNKTVLSASVTDPLGVNPTLHIDDGTGYEETTSGVATETLEDSAQGGEQFYQLTSPRPIAKAFVKSVLRAPFTLSDQDVLAVKVGGVLGEHTFNTANFISIGNATAYEVCASINANPDLKFYARIADSASRVSLISKEDTNEDIEVVSPSVGENANDALGFPSGVNYTIRLFKNDLLLTKDGEKALLYSNPQSDWNSAITDGDTVVIKIDGKSPQTLTINDSDFVNLSTGFLTVASSNSLSSWAAVLNSKLIGATVTVSGNRLLIESNMGLSADASVEIVSGDLVTNSMFVVGSASGKDNDYQLNRNSGQIKLTEQLDVEDTLVAATEFTRGYLQSGAFPSGSVTLAGTANLWIAVDGATTIVPTGVTSVTTLTISSVGGGDTIRARYTAATNGTFSNLQLGDYVIIWDPAFSENGVFKVTNVDTTNYAWFEVNRLTITAESPAPTSNGIVFARSSGIVQNVQVAAGTYTLDAMVDQLNADLIGATASTYKNKYFRISTNTYESGDIMLLTADTEGQKLTFTERALSTCEKNHFAVVESVNSDKGTPWVFSWDEVSLALPDISVYGSDASDLGFNGGTLAAFLKDYNTGATTNRVGNAAKDLIPVQEVDIANETFILRSNSKSVEIVEGDRLYASIPFHLGAEDTLSILLDGDETNKSFNINMFRNIRPDPNATYGTALFEVDDADNGYNSLYSAFGANTSIFNDFALFMKARGKAYSTTTNKTILFRNGRYGPEGESIMVGTVNPTEPDADFEMETGDYWALPDKKVIKVKLPSGAAKTGHGISAAHNFVHHEAGDLVENFYSLSRSGTTVTCTCVNGGTERAHLFEVDDIVYLTVSPNGTNFPLGPKKVTGVTNNTFTYTETGTDPATNVGTTSFKLSQFACGKTYTITAISSSGSTITCTIGAHNLSIGDWIGFAPAHTDANGVTIPSNYYQITGTAATTISFAHATTAAAGILVSNIAYQIGTGLGNKTTLHRKKVEVLAGNLSRTSNVVTATYQNNPLGAHPYVIGSIVYCSGDGGNFASGYKTVLTVSPTTFTYNEVGPDGVSGAAATFVDNQTDINFTGGGTPVTVGTIVNIDDLDSFTFTNLAGAYSVASVASDKFTFKRSWNITQGGTVAIKRLNNLGNLSFYSLGSTTAGDLETWVNSNLSGTLSATLVQDNAGNSNDGSATLSSSSYDEWLNGTTNGTILGSVNWSFEYWPLYDGINYVKGTNLGLTDSKISLKKAVSNELAQYANFSAENMRLVPLTAQNVADFLGNRASSGNGFSLNSICSTSQDGHSVTLGSSTMGSDGSVKVSGGTANSKEVGITGSGDTSSTYSISGNDILVKVPTNQLSGIHGDFWAKLSNTSSRPKKKDWSTTTQFQISATANPLEWLVTATVSGHTTTMTIKDTLSGAHIVQIERFGRYTAYSFPWQTTLLNASTVDNGDWVKISIATASIENNGIFRIVAIDKPNSTIWVENDGIEELVTMDGVTDYIKTYDYDSVMPGDTFVIGTNLFGAQNNGRFTVSNHHADNNKFYVSGSLTAAGPIAAGNDISVIKLIESEPLEVHAKINTMLIDNQDADFTNVYFDYDYLIERVSEEYGGKLIALDKLKFPTDTVMGLDGYAHHTGLLAEVAKIIYGEETDSINYPGIVAAGCNVDIEGPIIKRIQVGLNVKLRTGINSQDIVKTIKSSVAAFINDSPLGEPIAISDIVSVANGIDGVLAVSITSPTYNSINDLITVEPIEKPLVLDLNTDISVTISV